MTIRQKDRLERKRIEARLKGAKAQKDRRINKENQIEIIAKNNIEALIQDPLWLMGIILY
ncbi:MAG: hypothetical protein PHY32_01980 [Candidatus Pacebacteria bacterium]|nr:hypothetical protein [Candidatus Paceibacterota bacterium]